MKKRIIFSALLMVLSLSVNAFAYSVIPGGEAVGIIIKTQGVLVAGTAKVTDENGHSVNPAKKAGIMKGDIIVSVNNKQINTTDELAYLISDLNEAATITIIRNKNTKVLCVAPVKTSSGMKLGILARDSTAGIGTITFSDPASGTFTGLGHGICDLDTNTILPINGGNILRCELSTPTRGKIGVPGELNGVFIDSTIGTVNANTSVGISGILTDIPPKTPVEVCPANEVQTGAAYIYSEVDGSGVEKFSVEIMKINVNDRTGKNMTIKITDERLISKTGGIVQGMSGSPILQNGKIVGAVTHVFVNNPERGYGIFIDNMSGSTQAIK